MARFAKPDTRVHDALRRIGPLPVLGGTVARIRALIDDPQGTTSDLVAAIESDEAFAANLLRFANSATNTRAIRARTIRQAVTLVGRRALARIALEAEVYRFLERFPGGAHLSRGQLHVHAVTVAAYSAAAAELTGAHTDTAHLGGLLHDVGKLLMPAAFGIQALEEIVAEAPSGGARAQLERKRLGLDHAAAGALLVGLSEPSDDVTRTIAYHHGGPTGLACPNKRSRACRSPTRSRTCSGAPRSTARCSGSRSTASAPTSPCSTRSPSAPTWPARPCPASSPRRSAGSRPSPTSTT
jgi:putative nucleotidyltransferase with HDIG domain